MVVWTVPWSTHMITLDVYDCFPRQKVEESQKLGGVGSYYGDMLPPTG